MTKQIKPSDHVRKLWARLVRLEDYDGVAEAERALAAVEQLEDLVKGLNLAATEFGDFRHFVMEANRNANRVVELESELHDVQKKAAAPSAFDAVLDSGYGLLGKG